LTIKILDGAMGSELIKHGEILPPFIWSAQTNLTNPDLVYQIHKSYIENGADYITTNTFRATPRSFRKANIKNYHKEARKSFDVAINMAKKASDGKTQILGSIAPLEDCYLPNLFPGEKEAKKEFEELGSWFNESGVDIFLLETMNSIIETRACLDSIKKFNKPIWVSYNLLNSHQIKSGESLQDVIQILDGYSVDYLLLNCNPLQRTINASKIVVKHWAKKWGVYPNIGLGEPSPNGVIKNYHSNEEFLFLIKEVIQLGASIIGGCCGSNPKHINMIKSQL